MKKKQDTFHRNILVLALVALYFFTATTHILFMPCLNQAAQHVPPQSGNSIFKRKLEYRAVAGNHLSFVQRADKSTLEERKAIADSIKSLLSFFTILLLIPLVWRIKPKFFDDSLNRLLLPLHSYLSLCVIRI